MAEDDKSRAGAPPSGPTTEGPAPEGLASESTEPDGDVGAGPPFDIPLDPFVLEQKIGEGGSGVVWRGHHADQDVPVAVKLITKLGEDPDAARRRFRSEVRAVAGLDHPGIVTVLDYGETDVELARASDGHLPAGVPYLVTEFAEAGTLVSYLGEVDWPFCRSLFLAILDALAHAHARDVVHRDIKPTNILLDSGFHWGRSSFTDVDHDPAALRVKLTDFGLAFRRDDALDPTSEQSRHKDNDEARGTPYYMAPEQLQSRWRDFGPWTDLYGLGCMAWQLVTGERPFEGESMLAVARAQLVESPPYFDPLFEVPDRLVNWLVTLLQKRPEDRFQTAADAAAALVAMEDQTADEPAGPAAGRATRPLRTPDTSFPDEWKPGLATLKLDDSGDGPRPLDLPDGFPGAEDIGREQAVPPPVERTRPPLPEDWSRPGSEDAPMALVGAGRELFSLREFPLAGRDRERDHLWEMLRTTVEEQSPRLVFLHGPAGIGKTRLVEWLGYRAREVGAAEVLRANHDTGDTPLGALRDMLARHLGCTGLEGTEVRKRVVAAYDRLAPEDDDIYAIDALTDWLAPDREHGATNMRGAFGVLLQFLQATASRRPLVVHLDDVHLDGETLEWLHHVLEVTRRDTDGPSPQFPVIFAATYRDESLAERPPEQKLVDSLSEQPEVSSLGLGPLENHALRTLLERRLRLDPGLAFRVVGRADGNPLFASQLVRDWLDRGILEVGSEGFELVDDAEGLLPDDVYGVWSDRLERALDEAPRDQRTALELGAVLGRQPSEEEWRAVCHRAGVPFPDALIDELLKHRLLEETEAGWSFPHNMLRETLERDARQGGRWQRHNRACADVVRGLADPDEISDYAEAAGIYERLSRFWLEAEDHEAALDPLLEAIECNGRLGRLDAAGYLLEQAECALEQADLADDDPRIDEWHLKAGRYQLAKKRALEPARRHFQTVLDRSKDRRDDPSSRARALFGLARIAYSEDDGHLSLDFLRRSQRVCPASDSTLQARILREIGVLASRFDELDSPEFYFEKARSLLEDTPVERAKVEADMAKARGREGRHQKARGLYESALRTFRQQRCPGAEADVLNNLANIKRGRGKYQEAVEHLRRAESLAETAAQTLLPYIRFTLVEIALERDNFTSALEILGRASGHELSAGLDRLKTVYLIAAHLGLDNHTKATAHLQKIEAWENVPVEGYAEVRHFLKKCLELAGSRGRQELVSRLEALLERID